MQDFLSWSIFWLWNSFNCLLHHNKKLKIVFSTRSIKGNHYISSKSDKMYNHTLSYCTNGCGRNITHAKYQTCCGACKKQEKCHTQLCNQKHAQKNNQTLQLATIRLTAWENDSRANINGAAFHIPICKFYHQEPQQVLTSIVRQYKTFFGSTNDFDLSFEQMWGAQAVYVHNHSSAHGNLIEICSKMHATIANTAGVVLHDDFLCFHKRICIDDPTNSLIMVTKKVTYSINLIIVQ